MIMDFLKIKLKDLIPDLSVPNPDQVKRTYDELVTQLGVDFNGLDPDDIIHELKQDILHAKGDEEKIIDIVDHPAYILPLLSLWNDKESALEPTPRLLNHIEEICRKYQNGYLGLLQLRKMLTLFFSRYDELTHLSELGSSLVKHLVLYEDRELLFGLDKFKKQAIDFLNINGHKHLAELTDKSGSNLPDMAELYAIPTNNSRFFEAAVTAYYVTRLQHLKPNEDDVNLLHEVSQEKVYNTKADSRFYLGHHVLKILIDKLRDHFNHVPSELWLNTLLNIGRDPRVPNTDKYFQKWWLPLGDWYIQSMTSWLSEVDLKLFLDIFTNFADEKAINGNEDMQRMFEHRAAFLRGLLKRKCIISTRLFLSPEAEKYVKDNWKAEQSPSFAVLNKSQDKGFAAFYIYLGSAHMIEGTHNFALSIMDRLPEQSELNSAFTIEYIDDSRDLGVGIQEQYNNEFGKTGNFLRKTHHISGRWRFDAVEHLQRLGIRILEDDVISD